MCTLMVIVQADITWLQEWFIAWKHTHPWYVTRLEGN